MAVKRLETSLHKTKQYSDEPKTKGLSSNEPAVDGELLVVLRAQQAQTPWSNHQ